MTREQEAPVVPNNNQVTNGSNRTFKGAESVRCPQRRCKVRTCSLLAPGGEASGCAHKHLRLQHTGVSSVPGRTLSPVVWGVPGASCLLIMGLLLCKQVLESILPLAARVKVSQHWNLPCTHKRTLGGAADGDREPSLVYLRGRRKHTQTKSRDYV